MSNYTKEIDAVAKVRNANSTWSAINPESAARMRIQNRFLTGLDIARYTAKIMRDDMAAYDADSSQYTQSLGCWHGFIGQQNTSKPPRNATCTCQAGWLPHCVLSSAPCPISQCTKKPLFLR